MSEQQNKGAIGDLLKFIAGIFISKLPDVADHVIHDILDKHKDEIQQLAGHGKEPCPRGYIRDANGNCVPDIG